MGRDELKARAIDAARSVRLGRYVTPKFLEDVAELAVIEAYRRG